MILFDYSAANQYARPFLFFILLMTLLFTSCEEEDGACEQKIGSGSVVLYSCRNDTDDALCSVAQSDVDKVFHEGKSCSSLGYIYPTTNGSFTSEEDSYDSPGENGAFKDDTSGLAGCTGNYEGPTFDIQIDSQCQTAYAYTCSGSAAGVKAACAIYKTYQKDNPKIPDCPYCK